MKVAVVLAQPFMPQQGGGSQTSALELVRALRGRGHEAWIVCELRRRRINGIAPALAATLRGRSYAKDRFAGVDVLRVSKQRSHLVAALSSLAPDVVLFQAMEAVGLASAVQDAGYPTVVYWRDAQAHRMGGPAENLRSRFISNSQFTRAFYLKKFGLDSVVVPPLVESARYLSKGGAHDAVVFIGLFPEKGGDIATRVAAACPDIPFLFVESWKLEGKRKAEFLKTIRPLRNVTFISRQDDMRTVYGRARLIFAPSQWEEAWGRVASEAHVNGIPVLASRLGGLVEAVGPGGILLDPSAPVGLWVQELRRIWDNPEEWKRLAAAAVQYSARRELQPAWQIEQIETELAAAVSDVEGGHVSSKLAVA